MEQVDYEELREAALDIGARILSGELHGWGFLRRQTLGPNGVAARWEVASDGRVANPRLHYQCEFTVAVADHQGERCFWVTVFVRRFGHDTWYQSSYRGALGAEDPVDVFRAVEWDVVQRMCSCLEAYDDSE